MGRRYKNPLPGMASSVEHLTTLLSWNFMRWRTFVKDVLTALVVDGKVYSSELMSVARERYGVSPRTVQRWISTLVKLGVLEKHREGPIGEEGGKWYYSASPSLVATMKKMGKALERSLLKAYG